MLGPGSARRKSDGSGGGLSRSGSIQGGRASGEIIREEDEEIEEVDGFSPVVGPGEYEEIVVEGNGPAVHAEGADVH